MRSLWGLGYGRGFRLLLAVIIFVMADGVSASSNREEGRIYKDHNKPETLQFHFVREITQAVDGNTQRLVTYSYPDGVVAVIEKLTFDRRGELLSLEVEQKQLGEKGRITLAADRIDFSYVKAGRERTAKEKRVGNFVVGGTVATFLERRWDNLLAGEILQTRYGVVDRLETVGFEFEKVREEKFEGQDVIVVRMKPTNFIIAALVDPVYFSFAKNTKSLRRIQGRVVPKLKKGNQLVDFDGDFVFM